MSFTFMPSFSSLAQTACKLAIQRLILVFVAFTLRILNNLIILFRFPLSCYSLLEHKQALGERIISIEWQKTPAKSNLFKKIWTNSENFAASFEKVYFFIIHCNPQKGQRKNSYNIIKNKIKHTQQVVPVRQIDFSYIPFDPWKGLEDLMIVVLGRDLQILQPLLYIQQHFLSQLRFW